MKPVVAVCLTCTMANNTVVSYDDRDDLVQHITAEPEHIYVTARRGL